MPYKYFEVVACKTEIKDETDFAVFYVRSEKEYSREEVERLMQNNYPFLMQSFNKIDSVIEVDKEEAIENTNCHEEFFFTI